MTYQSWAEFYQTFWGPQLMDGVKTSFSTCFRIYNNCEKRNFLLTVGKDCKKTQKSPREREHKCHCSLSFIAKIFAISAICRRNCTFSAAELSQLYWESYFAKAGSLDGGRRFFQLIVRNSLANFHSIDSCRHEVRDFPLSCNDMTRWAKWGSLNSKYGQQSPCTLLTRNYKEKTYKSFYHQSQ